MNNPNKLMDRIEEAMERVSERWIYAKVIGLELESDFEERKAMELAREQRRLYDLIR